jgi:peptide/nickel transport system permease protein
MLIHVLRRLLTLVATLAFASVVIFAVLEVLPGDAAQTMLGERDPRGGGRARA